MDVSEGQARDYPARLYPEGSSNIEDKAINHNMPYGDFSRVREAVGNDVWEELEKSPIGVVAKLNERKSKWSGKTVHYLLCRQLRVHKKELWSVVVDQPIRFSLLEFGEITGLNTHPVPTESFEPGEQYKAFWEELNLPLGMGPKLDELRAALEVCPSWSFEKRKWLGLLLLQAMGVYAIHHNSRIPFEIAKRVFDDEAMRSYPWGRIGYEVLVDSIKMLNPQGGSYTISGLCDVLLVWAYESVTCFGDRFGRVINNDNEVVPLLRWAGKRTRASLDNLLAEEIREHGEVRVRKMVLKDTVEEMFPQWPGEPDDPQLDNLITDIHAGRFVRGGWEVQGEKKQKKPKKKGGVSSEAEPPTKKQKTVNKQTDVNTTECEASETGNNAAVMNLLLNISNKLSNYDDRFQSMESRLDNHDFERSMSFFDPKIMGAMMGDMVKAAVDDRLKSLGLAKDDEVTLSLPAPLLKTQQKSVNSPEFAKTPAKDLGGEKNVADSIIKSTGKRRTLGGEFLSGASPAKDSHAKGSPANASPAKGCKGDVDFVTISPAKETKENTKVEPLGRSCRNQKQKDADADAEKKKAHVLLKKKEVAEARKKK